MRGRNGGRTTEPDELVRRVIDRSRGVVTQADIQREFREMRRVDSVGEEASRYINGPAIVDGPLEVHGQHIVKFDDGTFAFVINTNLSGVAAFENGIPLVFYSDEAVTPQYRISSLTGHIVVDGTPPSIAAGAAAGTAPTVAILGSDHFGRIQVGVGTSPGTGVLATVTFANPYTACDAIGVLMWPADSDAAATGASRVYVNAASVTLSDFPVSVTGSALTASTTYFWWYATWGYQV